MIAEAILQRGLAELETLGQDSPLWREIMDKLEQPAG
jgi:hypothetical protein